MLEIESSTAWCFAAARFIEAAAHNIRMEGLAAGTSAFFQAQPWEDQTELLLQEWATVSMKRSKVAPAAPCPVCTPVRYQDARHNRVMLSGGRLTSCWRIGSGT